MSDEARETALLDIHALYGHDTAQQGPASAWLNNFSNSAEAWSIAVTLLDDSSLEAQFFAANMLLSKCRRDWTRLTPEQRSQLVNAIRCAWLEMRNSCGQKAAQLSFPSEASSEMSSTYISVVDIPLVEV